MSIGDKLKKLRKENNLTLKELHNKTGISISFISDIENKRRNPSIDNLKVLAKALNTSVSELLGENSNSIEIESLNEKDKKSINKDLKILMDEFRKGTDGTAYYNGQELDENDLDLIESAMKIALEQIKIKNKEKFTPKKYKK
ncbi:MAG: helix-turn-helix transcriptional regulator [Clostridium sp.]|mgnify:CR=1 FL=1|nr:helix-turn-helix transcriptional regulator [Clostridium sp.]